MRQGLGMIIVFSELLRRETLELFFVIPICQFAPPRILIARSCLLFLIFVCKIQDSGITLHRDKGSKI